MLELDLYHCAWPSVEYLKEADVGAGTGALVSVLTPIQKIPRAPWPAI